MYRDYIEDRNIKPENVIVYLRKSRADDPLLTVEEVLSRHEATVDEWAEKNLGAVVPSELKFREVVSGETIEDRPEIQKVLKMLESPRYKALLVVEVQRLSRGDLEDCGKLIKLLRYTSTLVITPQKIYDLQDEYDRDTFERELKRGNEYLEYTKKIMNRGRLRSVSEGNFIASVPPYGYEKIFITEGKRKCPTLKIKEDAANVVRMIFDMYVNQDMGRTNICHKLDSMGIKPPKGELWSPAALKDMLENVHYIGKVKWNWRKTVTVVEDGEIKKTFPKAKVGDYLIFDGKHEAIISEELFNAARDKQGRNHRAKASTKVRNPLAGLLYCKCGRAMSLRTYKKNGEDRSAPRLLCDNQVHCHTSSCTFEEVIALVKKSLVQYIEDFEHKAQAENSDSIEMQDKLIKTLEKKLKNLEERELSQWEAQANPDLSQRMPTEIFKRLNEKLLKEKEEVKEAISNAKKEMADHIDYREKIVKFKDALEALNDSNVEAVRKNRLLKDCIERIDYKREPLKRLKKEPGENVGSRFQTSGGKWSSPPIDINVKLRV